MPCSSLSHRQSPAGPTSQPPAPNKLSTGDWEVEEWRWDREKQKEKEKDENRQGEYGCRS